MSVPTAGETFAKLIHHIREAQDCAAIMSHLEGLNNQPTRSRLWLAVEDGFKRTAKAVTLLAQGKLQ